MRHDVPVPTAPSRAPRPVPEHQSAVAALLPVMPVEALPLAQCLGLALAEAVTAPIALPPFDNSAVDGYAVRSVDVAAVGDEGGVTLPVAEDVPAGRTDSPPLQPGTAHRIMTGAPMPPGADTVARRAHRRRPARGAHRRREPAGRQRAAGGG